MTVSGTLLAILQDDDDDDDGDGGCDIKDRNHHSNFVH